MLTTATRLLLVVLAERMLPDGRVKYPRPDLAAAVSCSERQAQRRLKEAIDADWLDRLTTGHNGRHAVYQATVPQVVRTPSSGTRSGTGSGTEASESSGSSTCALPVPLRSVRPDEVAGHLVSHSIDRASASERGAVDGHAALVSATTTPGEEQGKSETGTVESPLVTAARESWARWSA